MDRTAEALWRTKDESLPFCSRRCMEVKGLGRQEKPTAALATTSGVSGARPSCHSQHSFHLSSGRKLPEASHEVLPRRSSSNEGADEEKSLLILPPEMGMFRHSSERREGSCSVVDHSSHLPVLQDQNPPCVLSKLCHLNGVTPAPSSQSWKHPSSPSSESGVGGRSFDHRAPPPHHENASRHQVDSAMMVSIKPGLL
jgi:hypothetical protein